MRTKLHFSSRKHIGKRAKRKRLLRMAFLLLFLTLFALALFFIIRELVSYHRSRQAYIDLSESVLSTPQVEAAATPAPITGSVPWEQPPEIGFTVDWEQLTETNRYVRAWLYCPDTNISYPVVQYKDNEYFLNRNFNRREDEAGTLFFDYQNPLGSGYENWIIYGHRRNDGSMFGTLEDFADEGYYKEHPTMYLLTPEQNYRVELFSCRTVHAELQYFALGFSSEQDYRAYIEKAVRQSYWTPAFTPDTDTTMLTLATCSDYANDDDPRLLVHGRLVEIVGKHRGRPKYG